MKRDKKAKKSHSKEDKSSNKKEGYKSQSASGRSDSPNYGGKGKDEKTR